jgi:uncharacterized iron-regulated membrane protein
MRGTGVKLNVPTISDGDKSTRCGRFGLKLRELPQFQRERSHLWQYENERGPAESARGRADRGGGGKESFTPGGWSGGYASALTTHANMRFSKNAHRFLLFP